MLTALRTEKSNDDDKINAEENAKGYCIFCRKPICARKNKNEFYEFYCGCKQELKYYRTS